MIMERFLATPGMTNGEVTLQLRAGQAPARSRRVSGWEELLQLRCAACRMTGGVRCAARSMTVVGMGNCSHFSYKVIYS
ncbi:MAG: hypothetical protein Fur005_40160 [Roseiflexaceae bacterium]